MYFGLIYWELFSFKDQLNSSKFLPSYAKLLHSHRYLRTQYFQAVTTGSLPIPYLYSRNFHFISKDWKTKGPPDVSWKGSGSYLVLVDNSIVGIPVCATDRVTHSCPHHHSEDLFKTTFSKSTSPSLSIKKSVLDLILQITGFSSPGPLSSGHYIKWSQMQPVA